MSTTIKKKLRGGPVIEVDPQVLRWREKRKKLGLYKPARPNRKLKKTPNPLISPEIPEVSQEPLDWNIFK